MMNPVKRVLPSLSAAILLGLVPRAALAADTSITLDGDVPADGLDHFFLPFEVPVGTAEIEILHDDLSDANILDFGLNDPSGYRGWGGGTSENVVVNARAASRAYVPGPLPSGTWNVVVGKAKVVASPARYHVVVTFKTATTLAPQERTKYTIPTTPLVPAPAPGKRFYAVDFHVHSLESTDARPGLDEILDFAERVGLDAVEISDHNTVTQLDFFSAAQGRHPKVLLLPGIEYTTYAGHANAIGATNWVDHKIGQPGVTVEAGNDAIHAQGALFSVNHPSIEVGNACIGCAWKHTLDPMRIDAVEVGWGGWAEGGFVFDGPAFDFWDGLCSKGAHVAALTGSDDHKAGVDVQKYQSPIGHGVTMVEADELSVPAILAGVRAGRTVVKLQDKNDPMVALTSAAPLAGSVAKARSTVLRGVITGQSPGLVVTYKFVKNGIDQDEKTVTSDPFVAELDAVAPATGEDRYRIEVLVGGKRRTVTSHVFLQKDPTGPDPVADRGGSSDGCSVREARRVDRSWGGVGVVLASLLAFAGIFRKKHHPGG
jgi:hypothetical protein